MSEWKEYKLGELGVVITGKTPSKNNPEDWGNEMPFVTPSDYRNYGKFAKKADRNLSQFGIDRLKGKVLPPKSILVTCIGSDMGKVVINTSQVITNQQINAIIPNSNVDSDFLYYRLVSMYETLRIYGGDGTAVPIVNKGDFENIETEIPPLPEQRAIAFILSSLDDKIDLLHRQNATLEKIAETLFRQWFVEREGLNHDSYDFSDVHDLKNQGNQNNHKNQGSDNLEEAKEEWEVVKLGDFIQPKKGKNITKTEAIDGEYPVVAGGLEPSCFHNQSNTKAPVITISASGANAGFVRLYNSPVWSSDSSYIDETITPFIYFFYIFLKMNQDLLFDKQEGSAQPHIYPSHITELEIFNIPESAIIRFETEVKPYFQKIKSNQTQILTLTALRDTLLPKLMSGEVRVEE